MNENDERTSFKTKLNEYAKNLFKFSHYSTKTKLYIILFLFLVVLSLGLLFYMIFFDPTILYRIVVEFFVNPIYLSGFLGIFLFIGIMAIQGLIVPLPSEVVLFMTGLIWGWAIGGFMGIIGSMAAGSLCFYISRKGGRPLVEKLIGEKGIDVIDEYIRKHEIKAVILLRFIPFVPFDVVSYVSGLVDIDFKRYSLGTFIGSIFRAFFYSILGSILLSGLNLPVIFAELPIETIDAQSNMFNFILFLVFAVFAIMFLAYYLLTKRINKKEKELKEF
ncbi:MAG: VTT domain-containing protein [Candidatus Lokiarchaeota archaeon]|nr:VTT domain-containing protein [Candidatus Lokiarchaeota archaeon]